MGLKEIAMGLGLISPDSAALEDFHTAALSIIDQEITIQESVSYPNHQIAQANHEEYIDSRSGQLSELRENDPQTCFAAQLMSIDAASSVARVAIAADGIPNFEESELAGSFRASVIEFQEAVEALGNDGCNMDSLYISSVDQSLAKLGG